MAWPALVSLSNGIKDAAIQRAIRQLENALRALRRFSTTDDGLVPKSDGDSTHFLCADGTWKKP